MLMFDPVSFKKQFPLFSQPENCKLVYLDNAATSQRPQCVIDAVTDFYLHSNANAHRSSHRLGRKATDMLEQTRKLAAEFLGVAHTDDIVFTSGATDGLNLLAYSLCQNLAAGDEIVLSRAEHHANLVPWQMMAERHALTLRFIPDDNGVPQPQRIADVINERTRIVSITAASNSLGFITDINAIATRLDRNNIRLVIDGSQLPAHRAVNLDALPCDFFVCSAHKFYGPTGIGLLYGRRQLLNELPPFKGGGEMIRQVNLDSSTFAAAPQRFEAGTAPLADIAGLQAAMHFLMQQDRAAMQAYEEKLVFYLHDRLAQLPFIRLLTQAANNIGIAAFVSAEHSFSAMDVATWLDEQDIAVRAGHHCTQALMHAMQIDASVRVSLAAYNSLDDIDRLITALQDFYASVCSKAEPSAFSIDSLLQQQGQQRYKTLMQWGDRLPENPALRQEENRVHGCEARVWLSCQQHDGCYEIMIDSDSRIIRGLAVLLLTQMNRRTADEIRALDIKTLLTELGLQRYLSASRQNGVMAMADAIKACVQK